MAKNLGDAPTAEILVDRIPKDVTLQMGPGSKYLKWWMLRVRSLVEWRPSQAALPARLPTLLNFSTTIAVMVPTSGRHQPRNMREWLMPFSMVLGERGFCNGFVPTVT